MVKTSYSDGKAKPRGSLVGLREHQNRIALASREALKQALDTLLQVCGSGSFTKAELSRHAGLKSTVSLHSKINVDLLARLEQHNKEALSRNAASKQPTAELAAIDPSAIAALFDAEVVELLKENAALKKKIKALEQRLLVGKNILRRQA